ncbi:gastrula zinc finger protein XlCGF28.1-like%2C partial [Xyrichtys novacula]|uniref:Gastrula zinc finger protein XlCGF28.1-like, partial n=1 Tax=Xyrichtys novacula TaxID=13765 RepID=A0AAV1GFI9_XYRNO|nr:gastrula zinc finger protein XlCGF28.1-like%2C partial [Xyrichtys novacula]
MTLPVVPSQPPCPSSAPPPERNLATHQHSCVRLHGTGAKDFPPQEFPLQSGGYATDEDPGGVGLVSSAPPDDSAIFGLIANNDKREYRELNQNFVDWCQQNFLQINVQ